MRRTIKQPLSYFRLDAKLAHKLDRRIQRAGFTSRTEFFTAVAYVALYDVKPKKETKNEEINKSIEKLPKTVTSWIQDTLPRISEEEILLELHAVIEEMLYPVLAMKGVDVAYENTWEDVRFAFHERKGIWVTESDIQEAYTSFAAVHRAEFAKYREKQLQAENED